MLAPSSQQVKGQSLGNYTRREQISKLNVAIETMLSGWGAMILIENE